jgi:hypothetical protein
MEFVIFLLLFICAVTINAYFSAAFILALAIVYALVKYDFEKYGKTLEKFF